jgi:hypothetical protein
MSDWLRWPRLWYATPTFVLFVALQAPDWRLTGRVAIALVVWAAAGVALDVWMTRHQQQRGTTPQKKDIIRLINVTAIVGFVLGFPAGLYAHVFGTGPDSAGTVTAALNKAFEGLGVLLPALDVFHRELLENGRFGYAAYLGSFYMLVVILWLAGFFLFYCTVANMPPVAFARLMEANSLFAKPPYGPNKRRLAWLRLVGMTVVLVGIIVLFGRVLPMDAVHPGKSGVSLGGAYVMLAFAGPGINMLVYIVSNYRRFLSTLQPTGFLPSGESVPASPRDLRH